MNKKQVNYTQIWLATPLRDILLLVSHHLWLPIIIITKNSNPDYVKFYLQ